MIRTLAAIFTGQITIVVLNGIARMAVSAFLNIEFSLSGITYLPGFVWEFFIVALSLAYGLLAGLAVCRISGENGRLEILGLTLIIVGASLFDFYYLGASEPLWYFPLNSALLIAGLFMGYRIMKSNKNNLNINKNQFEDN